MASIRPVEPDDLGAVASMFQKVFRSSSQPAPGSLVAYLRSLLIEGPDRDPELPSLVAVDETGRIGGFICVLPTVFRLGDRTVRAACAGTLMVDDPARDPLIGARLLRTYMSGPQDLSFSETSNALSRTMWEKLGGRTLPAYSMDYVCILRPAGFGVAVGERKTALARALRPIAGLADRVLGKAVRTAERGRPIGEVREVSPEDPALAEAIERLSDRYALRPDWRRSDLRARLRHAADKRALGPLRCRLVELRGRVVGCYAYYLPPSRLAQVLAFLAEPKAESAVFAHVMAEADAAGCVAVRGRCQPEQLDAVLKSGGILVGRSSTNIHTRDREIEQAILAQDAWITGLACESWIRLVGDDFR